ncbi:MULTISPECIES: hypothetical protein [unclassified Kutzneria]|jgi:hypothetical protein|uniref:hypothetical protein n=1 Tax=unclassified Kutzneria TaxID=2621979 RepID=UPI0003EEC997|nr:hypothetical protein [Kutzneria sp. 744]EWM17857.1 hypothetical protein KUTG_08161 [Kutzneria sp. 744]
MTDHPQERAEWARLCDDARRTTVAAEALGFGSQLRDLRAQLLRGNGSLTEWDRLLDDIAAAARRVDGHITKGDGVRRRRLLAADQGGYVCPAGRCDRHEPWTAVAGTPQCGLLSRPMTEI